MKTTTYSCDFCDGPCYMVHTLRLRNIIKSIFSSVISLIRININKIKTTRSKLDLCQICYEHLQEFISNPNRIEELADICRQRQYQVDNPYLSRNAIELELADIRRQRQYTREETGEEPMEVPAREMDRVARLQPHDARRPDGTTYAR